MSSNIFQMVGRHLSRLVIKALTISTKHPYVTLFLEVIAAALITAYSQKANHWIRSSTKINYLQSIFQLGAATGFAFAIAGPKIRHAFGPNIDLMKRDLDLAVDSVQPERPEFAALKGATERLYVKNTTEARQGNPFTVYLIIAFSSLFMVTGAKSRG